MRNRVRIWWTETPLLQEWELKMQKQRWYNSRNRWDMWKGQGRQPQSLKYHLRRCWMWLEATWAIIHIPMMRRIGNTRIVMKMLQGLTSWPMVTNLAAFWAKSRKWFSTTFLMISRSCGGLTNWTNRDGVMRSTNFVREISSTRLQIWMFWQLWNTKHTWLQPHHHREHLERGYAGSWSCAQTITYTTRDISTGV